MQKSSTSKKPLAPSQEKEKVLICGPGGIQTPNLLIRSQTLYSVELRARFYFESRKFKRINPFTKPSFLVSVTKDVFLPR